MKLPKLLRNIRQYLSTAIIDRKNRLYPDLLENDHQKIMALGAVWCPFNKTRVEQLIEEAVQS